MAELDAEIAQAAATADIPTIITPTSSQPELPSPLKESPAIQHAAEQSPEDQPLISHISATRRPKSSSHYTSETPTGSALSHLNNTKNRVRRSRSCKISDDLCRHTFRIKQNGSDFTSILLPNHEPEIILKLCPQSVRRSDGSKERFNTFPVFQADERPHIPFFATQNEFDACNQNEANLLQTYELKKQHYIRPQFQEHIPRDNFCSVCIEQFDCRYLEHVKCSNHVKKYTTNPFAQLIISLEKDFKDKYPMEVPLPEDQTEVFDRIKPAALALAQANQNKNFQYSPKLPISQQPSTKSSLKHQLKQEKLQPRKSQNQKQQQHQHYQNHQQQTQQGNHKKANAYSKDGISNPLRKMIRRSTESFENNKFERNENNVDCHQQHYLQEDIMNQAVSHSDEDIKRSKKYSVSKISEESDQQSFLAQKHERNTYLMPKQPPQSEHLFSPDGQFKATFDLFANFNLKNSSKLSPNLTTNKRHKHSAEFLNSNDNMNLFNNFQDTVELNNLNIDGLQIADTVAEDERQICQGISRLTSGFAKNAPSEHPQTQIHLKKSSKSSHKHAEKKPIESPWFQTIPQFNQFNNPHRNSTIGNDMKNQKDQSIFSNDNYNRNYYTKENNNQLVKSKSILFDAPAYENNLFKTHNNEHQLFAQQQFNQEYQMNQPRTLFGTFSDENDYFEMKQDGDNQFSCIKLRSYESNQIAKSAAIVTTNTTTTTSSVFQLENNHNNHKFKAEKPHFNKQQQQQVSSIFPTSSQTYQKEKEKQNTTSHHHHTDSPRNRKRSFSEYNFSRSLEQTSSSEESNINKKFKIFGIGSTQISSFWQHFKTILVSQLKNIKERIHM